MLTIYLAVYKREQERHGDNSCIPCFIKTVHPFSQCSYLCRHLKKTTSTFVATTSSSKQVLLQRASFSTLRVSFFCHKSTGHWAAEAANLPHFPTSSICPEACPAGFSTRPTSLISEVIQPFAKPGRFLPGGMQPPSIPGFLKCICTRPPGRYYLFLRVMQLPPLLAPLLPFSTPAFL